jgi:ectoine hydroxylase-related dioxygenase (phytanoyl-CoA dioxygenase family)
MKVDLSKFHQPLTEIFSSAGADDFLLSGEQINFFHENGYLAGIKTLDETQIAVLRGALDELMKPAQAANPHFYEYHTNESAEKDKILFHALGAWRVSEAFHDSLWNLRYLVPAAQLLGGAVRFWHDQIFVKPARDGGVVAWHQDYSYWTRTAPVNHLTCWIGLDDSTRENGCVHYVPRSHRWNLLPRKNLANNMEAIFDDLTAAQKRDFRPVAVELKKGEASFHHPLTVHGSFENFSGKARRAVVINVVGDGVASASNEPLLAGVPPIPKGERLGGRFFPLLFNARTQ